MEENKEIKNDKDKLILLIKKSEDKKAIKFLLEIAKKILD